MTSLNLPLSLLYLYFIHGLADLEGFIHAAYP